MEGVQRGFLSERKGKVIPCRRAEEEKVRAPAAEIKSYEESGGRAERRVRVLAVAAKHREDDSQSRLAYTMAARA